MNHLKWLIAAVTALFVTSVGAQSYPSRALTMVVPFPPGGGGDMMARVIADGLQRRLGQSVVVNNRPGGDTIIGTTAAAQAAPDGYTMLFSGNNIGVGEALGTKLPYNAQTDFIAISSLATAPIMLLANPKLGVKSMADLLAMAKKRPGEITFAHLGKSAHQYLAFKMIEQLGGVKLLDVPYKGTGPATSALLGGEIDLIFIGAGPGQKLAESGKAVALGVTSPKRVPAAPDVPTIAEAGLPGFEIVPRFYMLAPRGTPDDIIVRLNAEIVAVMRDKESADKFIAASLNPDPSTVAEAAAWLKADYQTMLDVIRKGGIKAD